MADPGDKSAKTDGLKDSGAALAEPGTAASASAATAANAAAPAASANPADAAAAPAAAGGAAASAQISNVDGGAISDKVQIILVTPFGPSVAKLKERFASDDANRVYEASAATAPMLARRLVPCLVIGTISENTDVVRQLSLLKSLSAEIKKNKVKALMLSKIKHASIVQAFEQAGCHEYIVEPIPDRSLKFKIDLQTRAVGAQRRQMRRTELAAIEAKKAKPEEEKAKKGPSDLTDNAEQDIKSLGDKKDGDTFVFKANKVKKNGAKWTMRMKGPDPKNGDWIPMKKTEDGDTQWRYVEPGEDPNKPKKGGPEFTGEKPTFKNGEWEFTGEKPKLAIVDENGVEKESKVSADKDGLTIGKDSKLPAWKVKDAFADEKDEKSGDKKSDPDAKPEVNDLQGLGADQKSPFKDGINPDEAGKPKGITGIKEGDGKAEDDAKGKDGTGLAGLAMDLSDGAKKWGDKSKDAEKDKAAAPIAPPAPEVPPEPPKWKGQTLSEQERNWVAEEDIKRKKEGKLPLGLMDLKKRRKEADDAAAKAAADPLKAGDTEGEAGLSPLKGKKKDGEPAGPASLDSLKKKKKDAPAVDEPGLPEGLKKKEGDGGVPLESLGLMKKKGDDAPGPFKGLKKGEEDGDEDGAANPDGLAGLAMDFEEEAEDYGEKLDALDKLADFNTDQLEDDGAGGTKKPGKRQLSDEQLKLLEKAGLKQEDLKKKKEELQDLIKKKKAEFAAGEALAKKKRKEREQQNAASLDEALKKKKDLDLAGLAADDEDEGGGRALSSGDDAAGSKMRAHDSDQSEERDEKDQLVEIDSVTARMNVKEGADGAKFEYPLEHFGSEDGTWECPGIADNDEKGVRLFLFVEPWIRVDKTKDIEKHPVFWLYRFDERPKLVAAKKKWVFKAEPRRVDGFKNLSLNSQAFLINMSARASPARKAEAKKAAEAEFQEKIRQREEEKKKERDKEKAAEAAEAAERAAALQESLKKKKQDDKDGGGEPLFKKDKKKREDEKTAAADDGPLDKKKEDEDGKAASVETEGESDEVEDKKEETSEEIKRKKRGGAADAAAEALGAEGESESGEATQSQPEAEAEGLKKKGDAKEATLELKKKKGAKEGTAGEDALPEGLKAGGAGEGGDEPAAELTAGDAAATPAAGAAAELAPAKKPAVRLPSAPMMAVVLSEMMMFGQGKLAEVLERYFAFLSGCFGGARVSLYVVDGKVGRVVASNSPDRPPGHAEDFGMNQLARDAVSNRTATSTPDGATIYCAVLPLPSLNPTGQAIGLVIIEPPPETAAAMVGQTRYLQSIAQCFRGLTMYADLEALKAAALKSAA